MVYFIGQKSDLYGMHPLRVANHGLHVTLGYSRSPSFAGVQIGEYEYYE